MIIGQLSLNGCHEAVSTYQMTGFANVVDLDKIKVTLHVTMEIKEWKHLQQQLEAGIWPSSSFKSLITELVRKVYQHFYVEET